MVVVPVMEAGGAERGTALLLQHLDRQIVRPELAIAFDREIFYPIPSDVWVHILERQPEPQQAMSEPTLPPDLLEYRNSVLWLEKMALKLATLVKEQKSDVIFSTQLWSSIIATMARKYLPPHVRVIAMVVSHPSTCLPGEKYATLYTYLMRRYFNEADRIVAVSEGIAQDLVDNYGVKPEKIDVIHYPVDWAKVQELAQEPVEHEWFSQEIPIVLFVGRLEAVKGVEHLLRAFAKVRRQMAARCVLVGDGQEREKLQELAHQLGIEQDVYFAGMQSNPFKYMKRATSFVLPSLSEGLPNVLIEAMACGCPVIATDVASGGSREVLGGGEYGILVPPGDEEGLAQAILRVLQDPALRKRLSRLASQYAQKFDVHEIVPQYARLLKPVKMMVLVPTMRMGGAERNTALLLEHIDRGLVNPELALVFNREIFYSIPKDVPIHVLENIADPPQLPISDDPQTAGLETAGLEKKALKLAGLVQKRHVDILFSTQLWTSIIAALARKHLPSAIRVIATVDCHPSTFLPSHKHGELYTYLMRRYFNEADRIVAVSEGIAQDLVDNYGVKPEKIDVIHYPVDWAKVQELAQEPVEHEWFSQEIPIVLFVGRLEAVKGVEHLLRAFAKVRRQMAARCVLVGDGQEREKLQELAHQLGIEQDVYFAGMQSNPFKYMKRATSFVLPSLSEGLPNVLIEAMACGCPVIATDVASGGSREVLGGGEYGILVPPGDEEGLAQAILRVLQDPALRKRLSRLASQYAQKFDALQSVQKYTHLIRRLHEEAQSVRAIKAMVVVPVMEAGGAERGTALLLQHLDRQIVRPELAIAFDREIFYPIPSDVWVHILERQPEPQQAMSEPTLPPDLLEYRNSVLWLEKMALKLATLVKEQKSDVIFSTQLWSSIIATMARKYLPPHVRVIAMVVSHPSTCLPGEKYATLYTYLMRRYFNEADRIVAVSEGIAQDLVDNYGVKPEKIDVIHYPVDWAKVQELAQEPVEHEWFSQEIPIVLFVGRLEAVKGVEHLLRAFAKVRRQMAARCVLVGDGQEREKLQELAHQLGIEQDVYFAGMQSNPFKYMKRATSFVLPSLSEGLPNVLIEAMACGCPVIATDVASGGSREVLGGGEYGILVPPGDEEGLAQAILRVLQDPALRKRLSRLASQYAQKFDVHEIFRKYNRLIVNGRAN
jgi:glycosyltransferase involved in cell wall biosynthesis